MEYNFADYRRLMKSLIDTSGDRKKLSESKCVMKRYRGKGAMLFAWMLYNADSSDEINVIDKLIVNMNREDWVGPKSFHDSVRHLEDAGMICRLDGYRVSFLLNPHYALNLNDEQRDYVNTKYLK